MNFLSETLCFIPTRHTARYFAVAGCAAGSARPLGTHLGAGFFASTLSPWNKEAYAEARLPRNAVAWLKALSDTKIGRLDEARSTRPFHFLATSLALDVTVDDLSSLPNEVAGIQEIYPNRILRLPPLADVHNVPEPVRENRASSWGVHKIGALAAWGACGARGEGTKVGILDTGVDAAHRDLYGKVEAWAEFDAQGSEVAGSQPYDDQGHGTHVAGTVAGGNTSGQWIGVAPEAKLCCAKVLGPRGGTDAAVQAGMAWALDQGVDVISMSLGGIPDWGPEMPGGYTTAIVSCLQQGVPVVIAIGNEGAQTTGSPGNDRLFGPRGGL